MTPLQAWLTDLRERGMGITVRHDGTPWPAGGFITTTDTQNATRYRFALRLAALGQAPAWWNYVAGKTNQPPQEHELPRVGSHSDPAGQAYPCATCGAPAEHVDANLLGWCPEHDE